MTARNLVLPVTLLLCVVSVVGQQTTQSPAGSNWQHVQTLPAGASIHLNAGSRHQSCIIKSVDADSLTCTQGKNPVYQRTEITSIKLTHRGRSTLIAAVLGFGVGAIVGAAVAGPGCSSGSFCLDIVSRGTLASLTGIAFGALGTPIGYFTDFTRSTVYKAP